MGRYYSDSLLDEKLDDEILNSFIQNTESSCIYLENQPVILDDVLGSGATGTVYKAHWKGKSVAVKILKDVMVDSKWPQDQKEISILQNLRHSNITRLYGSTLDDKKQICIIQEIANQGSLYHLLHECKLRPQYGLFIKLAKEIAQALHYCHSQYPAIVHRDLKPHNILLSGLDFQVKVADFGLAKLQKSTFLTSKEYGAGTVAYMAPEVFKGVRVSCKYDVYSYAIILWEMLTGQKPWSDKLHPMQIVLAVAIQRKRPKIPSNCPSSIRDLIQDCWQQKPELRPNFEEILQRLELICSGKI
eukprot:TRINITY_DN98684_c0_g1_i5.p1 TRINITY_DN98684_c0_g1~~TRINITY_DN98684_c0_g1_i5.p1  ORF type:complete len:355 (+),score=36.07 TRINITY_DN98684_c0_g1_i5:161-1066(+)